MMDAARDSARQHL